MAEVETGLSSLAFLFGRAKVELAFRNETGKKAAADIGYCKAIFTPSGETRIELRPVRGIEVLACVARGLWKMRRGIAWTKAFIFATPR